MSLVQIQQQLEHSLVVSMVVCGVGICVCLGFFNEKFSHYSMVADLPSYRFFLLILLKGGPLTLGRNTEVQPLNESWQMYF